MTFWQSVRQTVHPRPTKSFRDREDITSANIRTKVFGALLFYAVIIVLLIVLPIH